MKLVFPSISTSLRLSCAALALAALPVTPARAVLYNFNTTTQLADNFTKGNIDTAGTVEGTLINAIDGGLGDSGSLQVPTGTDSFIYTTDASVSATFSTINVSVYFKAQTVTLNGGLPLTIGLVDALPTASEGGAPVGVPSPVGTTVTSGFFPANSFTLSLRLPGTTGAPFSLAAYNNGAVQTSFNSDVTLTNGNWYLLEASYAYNGSNSYTMTGHIYNSDNDGVVGTSVLSNAWTATNAGLADGDTFFLLSSQNGVRRGIGRLDNFAYSAVPEPSSAALLTIGGLGILAFARRRRSQRMVG